MVVNRKGVTPGTAPRRGAAPGYDPEIEIAQLRELSKEQQRRSERLEEAIVRLADAKAVDTNLVSAFDQLVVYLEPLQELRELTPRRLSPDKGASNAFQAMRDGLQSPRFATLTSVHADTRAVSYIGTSQSPSGERKTAP